MICGGTFSFLQKPVPRATRRSSSPGVQKPLSLLLLIGCVLLSCADDPGKPSKACSFELSSFSGITETDADGIVTVEDPEDWCLPPTPSPHPTPYFALLPPHPNPMGTGTTIHFIMASRDSVFLAILDSECTVRRTLAAGPVAPGEHLVLWNGRDDLGTRVPPGIYCCVMVTGSFSCCGDIDVQ